MSFAFEVLYKPPPDSVKETQLTESIRRFGGRLDFREEPPAGGTGAIVLTYDFDDYELALKAAEEIRKQGGHIEGPYDYGS